MTTLPTNNRLSERAILVSFHQRYVWKGEIGDIDVLEDAAKKYNIAAASSKDIGKADLNIFPGCRQPLDALLSAIGAARNMFKVLVLPWGAAYILPADKVQEFHKRMAPMLNKIDLARQEFYDAYPQMVAQALNNMGAKANPALYIDRDDIPKMYQVKLVFAPVPDSTDFRCQLPPEMLEDIKKNLEADATQQSLDAVKEIYSRLAKNIQSALKNLKGDKIRPEWHANLQGFIDSLEASADLFNSAELRKLAVESKELVEYPPDVLRDNPAIKETKRQKAEQLANDLEGMM